MDSKADVEKEEDKVEGDSNGTMEICNSVHSGSKMSIFRQFESGE